MISTSRQEDLHTVLITFIAEFIYSGICQILKRRAYAEVEHKKVLISFRVPVRIKSKVSSNRSDWKQILQAETNSVAKVLEILIKRI